MLAENLGATVLDRRSVDRSALARILRRTVGNGPAQAWLAFHRRADADVIVTDGEHVGIPLAFLLAASRSRVKHITIGHRLTSPKKQLLLRTFRAHDRIDRIAVHSRHQRESALNLGVPAERLAFLPYQVDSQFWSPTGPAEERLIVSAGLEHRDYPTLMRAARGLDAQVVIGAASNWSRHEFSADVLPANVRVGSFDYFELRDLYARAAVVVVPLLDVDNQAGVTTILEAMSMGKAVIVSQTRGQTDVVEDRRAPERGEPRARPISLARILAAERRLHVEPNGFYVPPGDEDALRRAINYLLDHPAERAQLGRAGRDLVTSLFTVDDFAARIAELVRALDHVDPDPALPQLRYG